MGSKMYVSLSTFNFSCAQPREFKWLIHRAQLQAKHMRVVCRHRPASRPMVHMHSALWGVCLSWMLLIEPFQSKSRHLGDATLRTNFRCFRANLLTTVGCIRYLDIPRLLSWLSSRQCAPEGGFSGRTNKLVDGCYSHWVGGCWPLVEASLCGPEEQRPRPADGPISQADDSLFNRNGLIRYILCCCQDLSKRGGLRDKPSK